MDTRDLWELIEPRLERIEQQAITTNGRVRKLEQWRHFVNGARSAMTGAFHGWLALAGVAVGLIGVAASWVAIATS